MFPAQAPIEAQARTRATIRPIRHLTRIQALQLVRQFPAPAQQVAIQATRPITRTQPARLRLRPALSQPQLLYLVTVHRLRTRRVPQASRW